VHSWAGTPTARGQTDRQIDERIWYENVRGELREVADEQLCVHEVLCAMQTQSVDMSRRYWIFESRERPSRTQSNTSQQSDYPINTEEE
jgi:hypothetical protein